MQRITKKKYKMNENEHKNNFGQNDIVRISRH